MQLTDVVPNLIVTNIASSTAFYRDVLAFRVVTSVPDEPPFAFVWLQRDGVSVFLNASSALDGMLPDDAQSRPIGGTATMFVTIEAPTPAEGIDALMADVDGRAKIVMPLKDQFYGMREFAVEDPDGYIIIFAQRIAAA